MVNINELRIGGFYKFIIEEIIDDEEKRIVDMTEVVGYYTGQLIAEERQILIVDIL